MKSRILGNLIQSEYDEDFYESELVKIPYFNLKEMKIGYFEPTDKLQFNGSENTIEEFLKLNVQDRKNDSKIIYDYYKSTLDNENTKEVSVTKIEDIWNYIKPLEITIDSNENGVFSVNVSCGCKWEEEHGLQMEFKNGIELIRAGGHE